MSTMIRPPEEDTGVYSPLRPPQPPRPPRPPRRRWAVAGGLAALAVVAILIGGIVVAGRGGSSGPAPAAPAVTAAQPPAGISSRAASAAPAAGSASALQTDLVAVAQKIGPAVVSIRTDQGLGSGVIYDAGGLVLTNAHVVAGANTITVGLADGRHFPGKVLGVDTGFDVAVVQISGQNLPTAPLGDSARLQVGQFVVAIGNPYGFDHTVTTGVVSALNRPVSEGQGSYAQPMIQTDAAINPGNSGGPLVDLQGNVIGITTLVAAPQGFPAQGLGFAIPVDAAKRIAPQLATDGHVTHSGQPFLGVSVGDVGGGRSAGAPAGVDHGVLIARVAANGPAAQAGLRAGDVVTSFDGKQVYSADDFLQDLVLHRPGDQVRLGLVRGGQQMTVTVTVGEAPVQ